MISCRQQFINLEKTETNGNVVTGSAGCGEISRQHSHFVIRCIKHMGW